jgi:hypothetical protein
MRFIVESYSEMGSASHPFRMAKCPCERPVAERLKRNVPHYARWIVNTGKAGSTYVIQEISFNSRHQKSINKNPSINFSV